MRVAIPIFHHTEGQTIHYTTVGLGPLSRATSGRSAAKVEKRITDGIRRAVAESPTAQLKALELSRGMDWKRVRLDVEIRSGRGKKKYPGLYPIILEPVAGTDHRLAYHPWRQQQWIVIDRDRPLKEQLNAAFSSWWAELKPEAIEKLTAPKRAGLKLVSFNIRPPSLLDSLEDKQSLWDDLRRKEEKQKKRFEDKRGGPPEILRKLAVDVTLRAADESLEVGRPREPYRKQLQQLLIGEQKQPTVLVGPSGAGKRTLLRRLVADILAADGYEAHRNLDEVTHVWSLTASRLISGMSHVGDWEQRCVQLVEGVAGRRILLWVEDLHTFGRVGQSRSSSRSVADFFRGPLARGAIQMIGSCTETQWRHLEHEAPAFADTFMTLRVAPATNEETLRMLLHEARLIEQELACTFEPQVFTSILELGAPLIPDTALPGKALDLMRRLARSWPRKRGIGPDEVVDTLGERTGLPSEILSHSEPLERLEITIDLEAQVMGQPRAVDAAADLILRIRGGMVDPARPYGTYLFTGPTGTGKTQLAKALAAYLYGEGEEQGESRLVRFDMGELAGPDAVPRLIGHRWAPRGLLTEAIRQQPFSVVLLDEIEKAHPSVLYLLLQLLEDGRLTDAAGDRADFTQAVVIMTSNLGARARPRVGFGQDAEGVLSDISKAVREFFPPELFNRIERVVPFEPLSDETAARIADKELAELLARRGLSERNVFVFTHRGATDRMAREAFDSRAGARSVKRYLETRIGTLLSEHLASTVRPEMEILHIYDAEGRYQLRSESLVEAEPDIAEYALSPLLDASTAEITEALPEAEAFIRELRAEGGPLEQLGRDVGAHLQKMAERDDAFAEHADAVFVLDHMRQEVERFQEHLEAFVHAEEIREEADLQLQTDAYREQRHPHDGSTHRVRLLDRRWLQPPMPRLDKRELFAALAEVHFLRRLLQEPALQGHSIQLELTRIGAARQPKQGALFWALAMFYAHQRGEVTEAGAWKPDGTIVSGSFTEVLHEVSGKPVRQLVLNLMGIGVADFFAGEEGCHVWSSVAQGSEVVRVRVLNSMDKPAALLDENKRALQEYEDALDQGRQAPVHPESLLPVVRRIRFDPPRRPGGLAPCEVEDYRLAQVQSARCRRLHDLLPTLMQLRMSRKVHR